MMKTNAEQVFAHTHKTLCAHWRQIQPPDQFLTSRFGCLMQLQQMSMGGLGLIIGYGQINGCHVGTEFFNQHQHELQFAIGRQGFIAIKDCGCQSNARGLATIRKKLMAQAIKRLIAAAR